MRGARGLAGKWIELQVSLKIKRRPILKAAAECLVMVRAALTLASRRHSHKITLAIRQNGTTIRKKKAHLRAKKMAVATPGHCGWTLWAGGGRRPPPAWHFFGGDAAQRKKGSQHWLAAKRPGPGPVIGAYLRMRGGPGVLFGREEVVSFFVACPTLGRLRVLVPLSPPDYEA